MPGQGNKRVLLIDFVVLINSSESCSIQMEEKIQRGLLFEPFFGVNTVVHCSGQFVDRLNAIVGQDRCFRDTLLVVSYQTGVLYIHGNSCPKFDVQGI